MFEQYHFHIYNVYPIKADLYQRWSSGHLEQI